MFALVHVTDIPRVWLYDTATAALKDLKLIMDADERDVYDAASDDGETRLTSRDILERFSADGEIYLHDWKGESVSIVRVMKKED